MTSPHRLLALLVLLTVLLLSAPLSAAEPLGQADFTLIADEYILVEVVVQDSIRDRWLLDTWAGVQVVSQATFDKLATTPAGRLTGFRMMGERLDANLYHMPSLEVAGLRRENVLVAPWAELDGSGINGIVSLKFFEQHPITIDFANNKLIVETSQSVAERAAAGAIVPAETQRYRDKAVDVFAYFKLGDSVKAELELDTGSGRRLWIDSRFMAKLGMDPAADSVTAQERDGQTWHLADLRHVSLWEAPAIATDSIRATFRDSLIYDGVMGIAFWDGRILTIDLPNRRLIIN